MLCPTALAEQKQDRQVVIQGTDDLKPWQVVVPVLVMEIKMIEIDDDEETQISETQKRIDEAVWLFGLSGKLEQRVFEIVTPMLSEPNQSSGGRYQLLRGLFLANVDSSEFFNDILGQLNKLKYHTRDPAFLARITRLCFNCRFRSLCDPSCSLNEVEALEQQALSEGVFSGNLLQLARSLFDVGKFFQAPTLLKRAAEIAVENIDAFPIQSNATLLFSIIELGHAVADQDMEMTGVILRACFQHMRSMRNAEVSNAMQSGIQEAMCLCRQYILANSFQTTPKVSSLSEASKLIDSENALELVVKSPLTKPIFDFLATYPKSSPSFVLEKWLQGFEYPNSRLLLGPFEVNGVQIGVENIPVKAKKLKKQRRHSESKDDAFKWDQIAEQSLEKLGECPSGYMRLFHGTNPAYVVSILEYIDATVFAKHTDFGPAFYTSPDLVYSLEYAFSQCALQAWEGVAVIVYDIHVTTFQGGRQLKGDDWKNAVAFFRRGFGALCGLPSKDQQKKFASGLLNSLLLVGKISANAKTIECGGNPVPGQYSQYALKGDLERLEPSDTVRVRVLQFAV